MKAPRAAFDDEEVALGSREDCAALALRGDCEAIAAAGKAGIALDGYDEEGYSPAHYAAANGNCAALRALAAAGVDLNLPGSRAGALVASAAAGRGRCDRSRLRARRRPRPPRLGRLVGRGERRAQRRADALRALASAGVDLDEPCSSKRGARDRRAQARPRSAAAAAATIPRTPSRRRARPTTPPRTARAASGSAAPAGEERASPRADPCGPGTRQSDSDSDDD